jgi:hypothetical protein
MADGPSVSVAVSRSGPPKFWKSAVSSSDWIGGGEANTAHALKELRGGGGAADVPVFGGWIGADDQEIVGGGDTAVSGAGR